MNPDFHYYAAYCAAIIAGYPHDEAQDIAYSNCFTDSCSATLLEKLKAPKAAATTQLQLELMDAGTDIIGLQDITRIWASFHFLPRDLNAEYPKRCTKRYLQKYRLICGPNGELVKSTVELAKDKGAQAVGIAMHVLCDTWAHQHFAGTPSLVINNTGGFYEILPDGSEKKITFQHSASAPDDIENSIYTSSLYISSEKSIMNLGHGRAGHLPDYGFIRYKYLPAWGGYEEITKDNPADYKLAFCQMIAALKYLRGGSESFECGVYDREAILDIEDEIDAILSKRQADASDDWKALGEKLSGKAIEPYDINKYQSEYTDASEKDKDDTFLGKYILAALRQKSMVTNRICRSGNNLAGYTIEFSEKGFKGIKAYRKLVKANREAGR